MRVYIKIIFAILLGFIFTISVEDFLVPSVFADDSTSHRQTISLSVNTNGNLTVNLNWTPVPGARYYIVKRGLSPYNLYPLPEQVENTQYTDRSPDPSLAALYYSITAVAKGDEEQTSPVAVLPQARLSFNPNQKIPVLMYHEVVPSGTEITNPGLAVSIDEFEQQMIYFTEQGYNAMFLRDLHLYLINKRPLPEKTFIITFDDGYKSFHSSVYPVLKKLNIKASVAVIAHSMDENCDYYYISWQQAREMNKSGLVEVVSHTNTHKALPTLCPKQLSGEITISDKTIGKYLCYESNILVYPEGAFNNNTISEVKKEYKLGVTIMEGINTFDTNPFIVKRFKVFHGNTGEDLEKRFAI